MRIAIPNFPSPDSFVDNVAYTLDKMGHEVVTPGYVIGRSKYQVINLFHEYYQKAFPDKWTENEKWIVKVARENKLDVVLCLTQSLRQEVLEELRSCGVRHLVAWWGDTPANMRGLGLLAKGWSIIFIKDEMAVKKLQAVGLNAELLHEAMNPDWHIRSFKSIGKDVVVAGSYYGYRQYLVGCLLDKSVPLSLYGPPPPRWAGDDLKKVHRGRFIVKSEKSQIFGGALSCLNSTALSEGDSLNCRAFEIAGACGLQFIEDKPAVSLCFEPGSEVLVYRSVEEVIDYLDRAKKEPKWAMNIREAGHTRAHAHHTYEQRLKYLLDSLKSTIDK